MDQIVASLEDEKPSLAETKQRLSGIHERHHEVKPRGVKYMRLPNPTLNQDIFFILPPKLLAACVEKFPSRNAYSEAISVDTPSESSSRRSSRQSSTAASTEPGSRRSSRQSSAATEPGTRRSPRHFQSTNITGVEVVSIPQLGIYSRLQIEIMRIVESIQNMCESGEKFVVWLKQAVASKVPAALQSKTISIADEFAATYPKTLIPGLRQMPDYTYASLYCLQPPAWLNDGVIQAFCERLSNAHSHVRCGDLVRHAKTWADGRLKKQFLPTAAMLIPSLTLGEGVSLIIIPVNFGNFHWAGVYIDIERKEVLFYDSLNLRNVHKHLSEFAMNLIDEEDSPFSGFTAVDVKTPVQQDGHSCGLFVCLKFWWRVDSSLSKDVSAAGLTTRRLELLHFVLRGTKIKQD